MKSRTLPPPPPPRQDELPLLIVVTPRGSVPVEKVEPLRAELDASCAMLAGLLRSAVEKPDKRRLDALTSAVLAAHKALLTLNAAESHNARAKVAGDLL